LRLHGGNEAEPQTRELPSGLERLDAGERICLFLWGEPSGRAQAPSDWTWQTQVQRTPISGDQLALLSADGTEVQILRTDNLHTIATMGLHERWKDWLLRPDEGIWGLGSAFMTLRDRETWRVHDRLGLPLVQDATEFACLEPDPFAGIGVGASATFFVSDTGANRVVSISRDGGNQRTYAAGYAPGQVKAHHYTKASGQDEKIIFIAAEDGLYLFEPNSTSLRQLSGNWRVNDIAAAETRVYVALRRVNEVRGYTLPQFSPAGRYMVPGPVSELLMLRNHVVVACATPGGGELIWLDMRDMTPMGQMPLPFAVADMLYSPITQDIYLLSQGGEHLLQVDSLGRRVVSRVDLPRRARELLLVERQNSY
jgi:hypothetical protein